MSIQATIIGVLALFVGYGVAHLEWHVREAVDRVLAEPEPLPESWCAPEDAPLQTAPRLIRTRFAPEGYSAKQILGYREIGRGETESQYPGGKDVWFAEHEGQPALSEITGRK